MTDQELANILFVDIETVTGSPNYHEMDQRLKQHWDRKAGFINNPMELSTDELYFERAGIFAEFGQIVTIAVGYLIKSSDENWGLRVKGIADQDEVKVLLEFKDLLETKFDAGTLQLCAHNGREFDFPYICRRMLIHEIPIPNILDVGNMKPWEIPIIDTMNLWKFGDRKNFTSLDLLATLFNIETSKSDIDGSDVTRVYHQENGLDRITEYCKRDIVVTAQLFLKLKSLPAIKPDHIIIL
jgi:predicted PolB exonuclease-like 3'-5' exonuclease